MGHLVPRTSPGRHLTSAGSTWLLLLPLQSASSLGGIFSSLKSIVDRWQNAPRPSPIPNFTLFTSHCYSPSWCQKSHRTFRIQDQKATNYVSNFSCSPTPPPCPIPRSKQLPNSPMLFPQAPWAHTLSSHPHFCCPC